MKKSLSYLFTIIMFIPFFVNGGGKMHHLKCDAIKEINKFLYTDYQDGYYGAITDGLFKKTLKEEKQEALGFLRYLSPNSKGLYGQKIREKVTEVKNERLPSDSEFEKQKYKERKTEIRKNNHRRSGHQVKRRPAKKKRKKRQSYAGLMASWLKGQVKDHPLRALLVAGAIVWGGHELYEWFRSGSKNQNQQPSNPNSNQNDQNQQQNNSDNFDWKALLAIPITIGATWIANQVGL